MRTIFCYSAISQILQRNSSRWHENLWISRVSNVLHKRIRHRVTLIRFSKYRRKFALGVFALARRAPVSAFSEEEPVLTGIQVLMDRAAISVRWPVFPALSKRTVTGLGVQCPIHTIGAAIVCIGVWPVRGISNRACCRFKPRFCSLRARVRAESRDSRSIHQASSNQPTTHQWIGIHWPRSREKEKRRTKKRDETERRTPGSSFVLLRKTSGLPSVGRLAFHPYIHIRVSPWRNRRAVSPRHKKCSGKNSLAQSADGSVDAGNVLRRSGRAAASRLDIFLPVPAFSSSAR